MNCEYYQLNISKLLDQELDEENSAVLFLHMGSCAECRSFFRVMLRIESAMEVLAVPEPVGLANPVMELAIQKPIIRHKISHFRKFRETRIPLSIAAVVVVFVTAGTIALSSFFMRPRPEINDNTARIVYSYALPTVYIQAPQKVQH
jgi:predicted anti-sigma-YlaC factor YlaD